MQVLAYVNREKADPCSLQVGYPTVRLTGGAWFFGVVTLELFNFNHVIDIAVRQRSTLRGALRCVIL
jgi:hypothetical protein